LMQDTPDSAPHFDGHRYFNPGAARERRGLRQVLKWRFGEKRAPWPRAVIDPAYPPAGAPDAGEAVVTFIGHATFLLQVPGLTILTDPMFSDYCSPLQGIGPRRVRQPGLALAQLPPIDLILLSHNHYDHADMASLRALARRHRAAVVTLAGNAALARRAGFAAPIALDWWYSATVCQARVTATPARHFSRRGLWDLNMALWGGFMVEHGGARLFFAGDSGAGDHWADIGRRLGAPDLALLPIGAYDPRWLMAPVHMNPEEAVDAHLALGARQSLGMHFGTFRLTDEPIDEPVTRLRAACSAGGITNFDVLGFGESRKFAAPQIPGSSAPRLRGPGAGPWPPEAQIGGVRLTKDWNKILRARASARGCGGRRLPPPSRVLKPACHTPLQTARCA